MIAPKTLYLTDEDSNFEAETYWCEDKVGENDIKYIRADLVSQVKNLTDEEILGAIARGWCSEKNSSKTMDSDLAMAIADEIKAILRKAQEK